MNPALAGWHDLTQAAAGGLLTAIWQGALLAAAAGLGLRLVPKAPAAARFVIWFAVFLVVVALPVVGVWPHGHAVARENGHGVWLTLGEPWSLAIAAVWLVASLARAATLGVAAFRLRALWKRAAPVEIGGASVLHPTHRDTAARDGARELTAAHSHISEARGGAPGFCGLDGRGAQVCVSDEVDRPSVIGFFAPKILIPRWLLERLTPAELEQIVLHEAGHLGRADDWLNLAQKIALVVFPLNPTLAWVERRLCFERELACDERVLRAVAERPGARNTYAACLVSLAEHRVGRRAMALGLALGLGGVLGRESELARRVGRILRFGEWMRPMQARVVIGLAMVGLLGGAAGLERCPQVIGFSSPHPGEEQIAASLVAGTVNRLAYQSVVFRTDEARGQQGFKPTHRDGAAMNGAHAINEASGGVLVRRRPSLRDVTAKDGPSSNGGGSFSSARSLRVTQWVVMTAWEGGYDARLVLTTARLPVGSRATEGAGASGAAGEQPEAAPAQVYRYAAVPVQDGWLVIQL
jgi:BlaR1 peptidase M56